MFALRFGHEFMDAESGSDDEATDPVRCADRSHEISRQDAARSCLANCCRT